MKITLYPKYVIRNLFVHDRKSFFQAGYKILYPEYSRNGMTPWQHYVLDGKRKGFGDGNQPSDAVFFREGYEFEYPDVKAAGVDSWRHYAENGVSEGRDNGNHPDESQFFAAGYLEMYSDVARNGIDPWHHYVRYGKKEGRDNGMHPKDAQFYAAGYLEMYPDIAGKGLDPWHHYVEHGKKEGRDNGNHPDESQFFAAGYLEMYPDVARKGADPWHHYVQYGKKEGRDNGNHPKESQFFAAGYLEMYPDIARNGIGPWHHYVQYGKKEGRDNGNHPDESKFFAAGYLEMYQDVARNGIDPWHHYVQYGKKEGRDNGNHPDESKFFAAGYLEMYQDVGNSGMDPWHHYVTRGRKEGRDNGNHPGMSLFFADGYSEMTPGAAGSGLDPWHHYVLFGKKEGRNRGWNDYAIRTAGHEQETVKSLYLAPRARADEHRKKVLLIGHEFTISGAPLSLLGVAGVFLSEGYLVDFAVRDTNRINMVHMYDGLGADVFLLPRSTDCFPGADKVIRNYDFVIINTIVMGAYSKLCRKLNVPHIWFVREDLPSIQRYFNLIKPVEQIFFDDCENVLCVSKYVTDCLYSEYNIRLRYINNFINESSLPCGLIENQKKPELFVTRTKTFAVVGSVEKRKAQESAVAAFLYISNTPQFKDRWKLFFIGKCGKNCNDPSMGIKLETVTRNIPNIVWCGPVVENKWELFSSIDFFIVPSLEEASSRVAIEAAMLGKPVIVTTHIGAKYLAENGAGFTFEPGNSEQLREIIVRCLEMTDDEYRKMSSQIRLNYEQTSSFAVYKKNLIALINDASVRCNSTPQSKTADRSAISFRSVSSGKNVFSFKKSDGTEFEYINFVDFPGADKSAEARPSVRRSSVRAQKVGVVVPVYNGIEHLETLIPSLFKNTDSAHKFIFVDDCSDEETADFLADAVRGRKDCVLIRNERNLGFVKSINRGAAKALEYCSNFVMLNSDTEVPSGWLGRIMKPIFEDETISSVTPLSNRCNIFSFPFFENRERNDVFLNEFGLEGINQAIQNSSVDRYIDIPTGHGFCMAISGKVWEKIGGLNEALFGRGFGEENEWSLRAELNGFRNVLFPGLYVAHHEKGSFTSEEKKANCAAAHDVISVMFPSYATRVQNFIREYPSAGSIMSIYLSMARQRGYDAESFSDASLFMARMAGADGIFVLKTPNVHKVAVKLLGEAVFVGNAKNLEKTGIYNS